MPPDPYEPGGEFGPALGYNASGMPTYPADYYDESGVYRYDYEIARAAAEVAGTNPDDDYADYLAEGANPVGTTMRNRARGIADSATSGQMRADGYQGTGSKAGEDCGCKGTSGEFKCATGKRTTQLYPATRVPKQWRAAHQRVRGWHNVYIGSTMVAQFSRKSSANAFCRAWNTMMSHLGSAANFDIPTLTFMFNSVIDGGSGAWGLKNGFDPPMHGTGGTQPGA